MKDKNKKKEQLIKELERLRQRIAELETQENGGRQAEGEIELSSEEWETTFDAITDLVSIQDRDFKIVRVNKAYADTLGMKAEKLIGKPCYEVIHGTKEPWLHCPHKKTLKDKRSVTEEFFEPRLGIYLEVSTSPILNKKGEVIGSIHIAKDITRRKRTEKELQEQTYDLGERVKELNGLYSISKIVEETGISLEEMLQGIVDLIPPAWQYPEITCARIILGDQVYQTGNFEETVWKQANRFVVHGDQVGTLEVFYTEKRPEMDEGPFLKEERRLIEAIAERLGRIIERKRAEAELHLERNNFMNILDSMKDGVYIVNQHYDIQYINSVIMREFGPVDGKKCYDYFHDREEVCPWCKNQDILEGRTVRWEWYSLKNQRTYDLIDTPLRNPDGSISKLEIFRDITDRKKAEEELHKHQAQLEKMVEVRTSELTQLNKQLEQEIEERKRVWQTLRESEKQLQSLSSQLLTFQEQERKRVAQELHDSVGQILAALKYRVEGAINQVSEGTVEKCTQSLEDIIPKIQDAVEEVDRIGKGLRPLILDDLGIIATYSWFCREFEETYPEIHIEKEITINEEEVSDLLKVAMYRILQEGLNNIAKHSRADLVNVSL
ncbi:MAG: PAS domain S-box protein, partial [Deltaproteobacteria bacterium]|nr:PAS domain S-box protein [Deltaproteobacteria bacterium]